METACRLPLYGYLHFPTSVCDYPMSNTPAKIIVGNRELIMRVRTAGGEIKEGSFKVIRGCGFEPRQLPTSALAILSFHPTQLVLFSSFSAILSYLYFC